MVDTPAPTQNRYDRGIKKLNHETISKIQAELGKDPSISKSELSRRVGVSRQTLIYYMRQMGEDLKEAASKNEILKQHAAMTHLDLLQRIQDASLDITSMIQGLKQSELTVESAGASFRGYTVLERYYRLLGELLGEIAPPTVNVHLTKIDALLATSISDDQLPPNLKAIISESKAKYATS